MTDKSKPWLAAKTAGEAYGIAFWEFGKGSSTHLSIGQVQANALQAVIEWHEAQREKVGEYYEVPFCTDKILRAVKGLRYETKKVAADYWPKTRIVHVTRYRRKKR